MNKTLPHRRTVCVRKIPHLYPTPWTIYPKPGGTQVDDIP